MKTNKKQIELGRENIAGVQYGDYELHDVKYKAGTQLKLSWEKNNIFDERAIRIDYNGIKLGYVKKGDFQELLHDYREAKIKVNSYLVSFNKTNPTYNMFIFVCKVDKLLDDQSHFEQEIF